MSTDVCVLNAMTCLPALPAMQDTINATRLLKHPYRNCRSSGGINTNPYTLLALTGQRAYIPRPKDRGFTPCFGKRQAGI